jgi:hypothetical protein
MSPWRLEHAEAIDKIRDLEEFAKTSTDGWRRLSVGVGGSLIDVCADYLLRI